MEFEFRKSMEFCQQIIALPIFHFSLESIIDLLNSFEKVFFRRQPQEQAAG